jgi:hypothetical protein
MKKLLPIIALALLISSCEKKLPLNIYGAVYSVHLADKLAYKSDSTINSLTKEYIDTVDRSVVLTLLVEMSIADKRKEDAKVELDELLKYNAEFSNHPEVVNKHQYAYKVTQKYWDNIVALYNR